MNPSGGESRPRSGGRPRRPTAVAAAALLLLLAVADNTAEAFSASTTTTTITTTSAAFGSSNRATMMTATTMMPSLSSSSHKYRHRHHCSPPRRSKSHLHFVGGRSSSTSSSAIFGSLRDLIDTNRSYSSGDDDGSSGEENNSNNNNNNNNNNKTFNSDYNDPRKFSRSKFVDTKFRTRSVYGTGMDPGDGGLGESRLGTWSFATKSRRSGSEGNNGGGGYTLDDEVAELLVAASEEDEDEGSNGKDARVEGEASRDDDYDDYSDEMIVDNFGNMAGINYSKNSAYPVRTKARISDEDDMLGQHGDRLSTFSFSSRRGGPAAASAAMSRRGAVSERAPEEDDDNEDGVVGGEEDGAEEGGSLTTEGAGDDDDDDDADAYEFIDGALASGYYDHPDDPYDMVGVHYSKNREYPRRDTPETSDEEDSLGQHADRLSTFSFSSKGAVMRGGRSSSQSAAADGDAPTDDDDGGGATTGDVGTTARRAVSEEEIIAAAFDSFGVDNFHDNINVDARNDRASTYSSSPADNFDRRTDPVASSAGNGGGARDGLDNHFDRLSTFSLSSSEKDNGNVSDEGQRPATLESISFGAGDASSGPSPGGGGGGGGGGRARAGGRDDFRLGTFSFAGAGGGSTGGGGGFPGGGATRSATTASPPPGALPPPPLSSSPDVGPAAAADSQPQPNSIQAERVYSPPQEKGSLSSIASSVSIKSRDDRIREVRTRTDPKLLHPDGMNVPRLNSGGDVMSFSGSGGRPNIFQRIEEGAAASSAKDEKEGGGRKKKSGWGTGGGSFLRDLANKSNVDDDQGESTGDDDAEVADYDNDDDEGNDGGGDCFIGFDLGTSGARMSIVEKKKKDKSYEEVFTSSLAWDDELKYDNANDWRAAIDSLLTRARGTEAMSRVGAICVSGTSATCVLVDRGTLDASRGGVARMYNYDALSPSSSSDAPTDRVGELIDEYVPERHTARAATGSLAKLLLWNEERSLVAAADDDDDNDAGKMRGEALCHQSDYVSMSLMHEGTLDGDGEGKRECVVVTSDWHNCLKLGYDVRNREFPAWIYELLKEGAKIPDPESVLPSRVVSPGEPIGVISPVVASRFGLSDNVVLVGGTTDSNAAFFAAAGARPDYGTAVTSLGSTLAIKQLSRTFVEDASRGVYSHRFPRFADDDDGGSEGDRGEAWLVGGASNVGCAILRQEGFSDEELARISADIDPESDSPLSYYPLLKKGERFPVADGEKEPVLEPKPEGPDGRREYLHAILQGIGDVERDGFRALGDLGASPDRPSVVLSCGGGAKNDMWIAMRERRLREICEDGQRVEVKRAENTEASYGAALLAAASFEG